MKTRTEISEEKKAAWRAILTMHKFGIEEVCAAPGLTVTGYAVRVMIGPDDWMPCYTFHDSECGHDLVITKGRAVNAAKSLRECPKNGRLAVAPIGYY